MALVEHFKEFRNRLVVAALAVVVCGGVGWYFYDELISLVLEPISGMKSSNGRQLISTNFAATLTQPFSLQLRVSIFVGIVLASPIWLWQIWAFLLPGLKRRERRIAIWAFVFSVPLFFAGAFLAAWSLPRTAAVLLSFLPEDATGLLTATEYINFVLYFVVAFGLAFLLPVFMVLANTLRVFPVSAMVAGWRFALLGMLIFAAFATPDPSAWTMFALALPMFGLYWLAIGVCALNERRRHKKDPDWLATPDDQASAL